jgi:hypothetical protein
MQIMKTNTSTADRSIRLSIAVGIIILYITDVLTGTVGYILLGVAGIFAITGLVGVCPLYALFGISSCKHKKA